MDEKKFEINTHWILFLRLIGFTLDEILPEYTLSVTDSNYKQSLEIVLDKWIVNNTEHEGPSWKTVDRHIEHLNANGRLFLAYLVLFCYIQIACACYDRFVSCV